VPSTGRRFAPSASNVTLTSWDYDTGVSKYWNIKVAWDWSTNFPQEYTTFSQNFPISGDYYFLMEAHVRRGWLWEGYSYENVPGPLNTHFGATDSIYKTDRVEADIWTESPENFTTGVNHYMAWTYSPENGQNFYTLPRSWGQGFKLNIYRWWNVIHQGTGHGDPMDLISYRDDLNTFGPNTAASCPSGSSAPAASSSSTSTAVTEEAVSPREQVKESVSGDHRTVSIEVNDTDVDRLQAFVDKNGLDVRSIEFSTATGGGGWNNRHVLSLAEIKGTVEKVYGVQVSGFTKLRAVVSEAQLDKIQQDPMVKGIK
jgi:hypothetical protein